MANPAETYERDMVPALFAPWAPLLVDLAAPLPGESVLDVACGSGIVARTAAARMQGRGRVVGLDANPAMLSVARAAAKREGHAIDWYEAAMERLPFADGEFDVVTCQHGLQFSDDRAHAVADMWRVLRTDGRVAIAAWQGLDRHPFWATFNEALQRHLGIPALAAPFSLDGDELQRLLAAAGFREVALQAHSMPARFPDPDRFVAMEVDVIAAAIPATRDLDDRARAELAAAIAAEMAAPIRAAMRDGSVTIPMHAHLVRAVR